MDKHPNADQLEGLTNRVEQLSQQVDDLRDQLREYARLVGRARSAQTQYFRVRSGQALEAARRVERQLDQATLEILHPRQPKLF